MPSPDIIIEPIKPEKQGYTFKIRCSDIAKAELIRYDIKTHLYIRGHHVIDHEGKP